MPAWETQHMTAVMINELRNQTQTQGLAFFSTSRSVQCLGALILSPMGGGYFTVWQRTRGTVEYLYGSEREVK